MKDNSRGLSIYIEYLKLTLKLDVMGFSKNKKIWRLKAIRYVRWVFLLLLCLFYADTNAV